MTTAAQSKTRTEKDSMGEMTVPADALYGASTQRAVLNFPISGRTIPGGIIYAYGWLKAACASANRDLGLLNDARAEAIINAATAIGEGSHHEHFPVDVFQTGSGTSTNMNANEVIANLICQERGAPLGSSKSPDYIGDRESGEGVHPNDHVNMGQSSNDTFPTAMHVAAAYDIQFFLKPAMIKLAEALEAKASAWDDVVKIGRTHLQDATPIRLGQEFSGYAAQARHAVDRCDRMLEQLVELPIGGTAVGTGINTHPEFGKRVAQWLSVKLGVPFREAANHFEAQHAKDALVETSGHLKTIAVSLSKIAGDIRIMGMGPRCGIGELRLPAVQPGSSIMPGKVNPVICEAAVMVCCRVIGNDAVVANAALGGVGSILDLSLAMPVMAEATLDSIKILTGASNALVDKCINGLEPDRERCAELIEKSLAMCTSLAPVIGYDAAARLAHDAYESGKTVREVALEQNLLDQKKLDQLLDPRSMTEPGV